MDFWDKGFKELFDRATEKFRQQTHDDLQNEIAGRSTGRMKKFLPHGQNSAQSINDKQDDDALTALQMLLLNDPAYAALYGDTWDLLERAEAATEKALDKAQIKLDEAQAAMDDLMARAGTLPDGTAVFEDAHGNVWSENGHLLEDEALADIDWKDGVPSYEDYLEHKEAMDNARLRIDELREYQVDVLGRARDRLEDQKNPADMDGLKEIHKEMQDGYENIVLKNEIVNVEAEAKYQITSGIALPTLENS